MCKNIKKCVKNEKKCVKYKYFKNIKNKSN